MLGSPPSASARRGLPGVSLTGALVLVSMAGGGCALDGEDGAFDGMSEDPGLVHGCPARETTVALETPTDLDYTAASVFEPVTGTRTFWLEWANFDPDSPLRLLVPAALTIDPGEPREVVYYQRWMETEPDILGETTGYCDRGYTVVTTMSFSSEDGWLDEFATVVIELPEGRQTRWAVDLGLEEVGGWLPDLPFPVPIPLIGIRIEGEHGPDGVGGRIVQLRDTSSLEPGDPNVGSPAPDWGEDAGRYVVGIWGDKVDDPE